MESKSIKKPPIPHHNEPLGNTDGDNPFFSSQLLPRLMKEILNNSQENYQTPGFFVQNL